MAKKVKKTYEQIIEMADKKPLTVKQFDDFFQPIEQDNGYMIDDSKQAESIAKENTIVIKNNTTTKPYQHIWTVVDGESGKPCAINGWHVCNRLGYMVCKTPWGDGSEDDSKVYIEAKY